MQAPSIPFWLGWAETLAVIASVGGTALGLVTQQMAMAAVPLSAAVVLNLVNRQSLWQGLAASQQTQTTALHQQNQEQQAALNEQEAAVAEMQRYTRNLDRQYSQLERAVKDLQIIETTSEKIGSHSQVAEAYCEQALSRQRLGDIEGAIANLTAAIHDDPDCARAYYQRAVFLGEKNPRQAVADFRQAAKLYFQQGDINNYQQARDLCRQFYAQTLTGGEQPAQPLAVGNLFA